MSGGGWRLPSVVDPEETFPVCICIPSDRYHIAAFWGALQELGYWYNWERDIAHTALAVSTLWNDIISTAYAKYTEGTMCGNCDDFATCLEDPTFIAALDNAIAALIRDSTSELYKAVISATGSSVSTPLGVPPSETYLSKNWAGGTNPTCDEDILYAQCLAIVVETNRMFEDTLEKIEAWSNAGEFAQIVANLPILALITEGIGVDAALGVIDKSLEFLTEGYVASYTAEFETAVACALFCACRHDCQITASRIIDVMYARVSIWGSFPLLGSLIDWVTWFNANTEWGSAIADVAFYAAWSSVAAMGTFFLNSANIGVELITQRAANNPNADWIFCPVCTWTHTWNAANGWDDWNLLSYAGNPVATIIDGVVTGANENGGEAIFIYMGLTAPSNANALSVDYEYARVVGPNDNLMLITNAALDPIYGSSLMNDASGGGTTDTTVSIASVEIKVLAGVNGNTATGQYMRITAIRMSGTGSDPYL